MNFLRKPVKNPSFLLFVIFFLAIIAWIVVFVQYYFANQEEPSIPPSAVDSKK